MNNSLNESGWVDAYLQWGVSLTESSLSALMTPAPNKQPVENKSRLQHGKRVITDPTLVRKDERDVNLEMHITASGTEDFWDKYGRFCSEVLDYGFMELKCAYRPTLVFRMTYESCTQFSEFMEEIAKFTLRLNEPNPADRDE